MQLQPDFLNGTAVLPLKVGASHMKGGVELHKTHQIQAQSRGTSLRDGPLIGCEDLQPGNSVSGLVQLQCTLVLSIMY